MSVYFLALNKFPCMEPWRFILNKCEWIYPNFTQIQVAAQKLHSQNEVKAVSKLLLIEGLLHLIFSSVSNHNKIKLLVTYSMLGLLTRSPNWWRIWYFVAFLMRIHSLALKLLYLWPPRWGRWAHLAWLRFWEQAGRAKRPHLGD